MMPTNVAARMTLAADPGSLQGAIAAGILGAGPVLLGTSEECARLLAEAQERVVAGEQPAAVALAMSRAVRESGERLPGFGHPVHRPTDPRAERILELADERGVSGPHVELARCFRDAVAEVWGRPLTLNISMPMAAVMLDLGFPPDIVKGIPILARTAGLIAHLVGGAPALGRLPDGEGCRGLGPLPRVGGTQRVMLAEIEARPWDEQLEIDDAQYREQLAYLLERSAFYREKLGAAGISSADGTGGLAEIARLPLTEKQELRAAAGPEQPIGAHVCVEPVRDRADLLHQRHDRRTRPISR